MSYSLISAKARTKALDAMWQPVDIGTMKVVDVLAEYRAVWLTLSHIATTTPLYLLLDDVRGEISTQYSDLSINDWLVANGDKTLPTQLALPQTTLHRVQTADAWQAGYTIQPIDHTRSSQSEVPYGEKDDLLLTRDGVDFNLYHRYALVTVNGYVHRSGTSPDGLQVLEGGRSGRIANDNHVSILSFFSVGTIEQIPITQDMVYKTNDATPFSTRVSIELPYDMENKTVLLVLGGYLHVLDEVYDRTGPKSLTINFNKIAFPERYFESNKYLDLSSLPLDRDEEDKDHVAVSKLLSDDVIKAYLTLPQSFLVVVNTKDFFVKRTPVPNAQLPGRFEVAPTDLRLPIIGAYGKLCEYTIHNDWGRQILSCEDNVRYNYSFRTTHWTTMTSIDSSLSTTRPWEWVQAQYLEMGRFN